MAEPARACVTPQEYLARERAAPYKSEYYNGQIFAMSGASREHNLIAFNVAGHLSPQLRGRPCEGYLGDMRVKVDVTGLYTYPDVVVVCGEPRFEDAEVDTLLNPTLIIEVLSPSTEAYDRGDKFEQYRNLESLREFVLIAQHRCRVERYVRQDDGTWLFSATNDLGGTVRLASIDCDLVLSEVYDKVRFQTEGRAEA